MRAYESEDFTPDGSYTPQSTFHASTSQLAPPMPQFSRNDSDASSVSLSVNYLPHKFSSTMLSPSSMRKRKGAKGDGEPLLMLPKRGGGVDAFKTGEDRIPGKRLRWNKFKWALFFANLLLTGYTLTALIFCLLTWFNVFTHADVIRVGNRPELILSTIAASIGLFTSVIGWSGILLNNRSFLAAYTFLLWVVLAFVTAPGYITYKKRTFNLEGKINAQWSRDLGAEGRLRIQNQLSCCGYFSPFVEATISQTCYSRTVLPGCKLKYLTFERHVLERWYIVAFTLVPAQIGVILAGLLCSNHVTYRFGKGMMPEAYRLNMSSMAVIMDNYASQLADQYGTAVASEVLQRSRSNIQLDSMPTVSYQQPTRQHLQDNYRSQ